MVRVMDTTGPATTNPARMPITVAHTTTIGTVTGAIITR
jgi:hypothetical protein